jgi:hypothetical protein
MRFIVEVEGQGASVPEVVLRSTQQMPGPSATPTGAPSVGGGIDAGPAPSAEGATALAQGTITTPVVSAPFDPGSAQSGGAAPTPTTTG